MIFDHPIICLISVGRSYLEDSIKKKLRKDESVSEVTLEPSDSINNESEDENSDNTNDNVEETFEYVKEESFEYTENVEDNNSPEKNEELGTRMIAISCSSEMCLVKTANSKKYGRIWIQCDKCGLLYHAGCVSDNFIKFKYQPFVCSKCC